MSFPCLILNDFAKVGFAKIRKYAPAKGISLRT